MAVFDRSKVCTEWSDDLDGKKGWFSKYIDDGPDGCLKLYFENGWYGMYSTCKRGYKNTFSMGGDLTSEYPYFYPDDEEKLMEFKKENLFIAGYNDEQVNIGDEGYVASDIIGIKGALELNKNFGKIVEKSPFNFFAIEKLGFSYSMFYRTKCAPKKKYIPWTNETVPDDLVGKTVMFKINNSKRGIITFVGNGVTVGNKDYTFRQLMSVFIMLDGTLCGQEITE